MEPESSLPQSQMTATCSYPVPHHICENCFKKANFLITDVNFDLCFLSCDLLHPPAAAAPKKLTGPPPPPRLTEKLV